MSKLGKWRMGLGLSALSMLGALGCQAQVGDEYTGEVMLTLRGHVDAPAGTRTDLVPAIAFFNAPPGFEHGRVDIVRGKVEGLFPSDFQLTIAEPPPVDPDSRMAIGKIVLVPADFPSSFEVPSRRGMLDRPYPAPEYSATVEDCVASGACRERVFDCTEAPCDVIATSGDPEHEIDGAGPNIEGWSNLTRYGADAGCYHEESCYREIRRCALPDGSAKSDGTTVSSCKVASDTGDQSVKTYDDLAFIVSNLTIYYLAQGEPDDRFVGGKIGYNVVEGPRFDTDEDFIRFANCSFDAHRDALAEINAARGTSYRYDELDLDGLELHERSRELVAKNCGHSRVIDDTTSLPLQLDLKPSSEG